jgi:hypothetical protein
MQLQITSMALGHLIGFNQQPALLQLVTGLRSIPSLASMVAFFGDWPPNGSTGGASRQELQEVWDTHRRVGWTVQMSDLDDVFNERMAQFL